VAGVVFGALQAGKYFFRGGTASVQRPPAPETKQGPEVVKDNLPEAGRGGPLSSKERETAAVSEVVAPAKPQQAETPEGERVKDAARPKVSVQVGVFLDERNAAALAEQLRKKGFEAFVYRDAGGMKDGRTAHRVLVGRFEDRKKAAVQATALEKEGIGSVIYSHRE